jgi:hypothetical protein
LSNLERTKVLPLRIRLQLHEVTIIPLVSIFLLLIARNSLRIGRLALLLMFFVPHQIWPFRSLLT